MSIKRLVLPFWESRYDFRCDRRCLQFTAWQADHSSVYSSVQLLYLNDLFSLNLIQLDSPWQDSGLTDCSVVLMIVAHVSLPTSVIATRLARTPRRSETVACSVDWPLLFRWQTSSSWRRSVLRSGNRKASMARSWMIFWRLAVVLFACWCNQPKK